MNLDVNAVSELRARLWSAGYRPVPVFNANHTGINSPGKQPLGDKWQLHARMDPPFCVTSHAVPHALNTGVLADGLRPLDLDIDNPEKARECQRRGKPDVWRYPHAEVAVTRPVCSCCAGRLKASRQSAR